MQLFSSASSSAGCLLCTLNSDLWRGWLSSKGSYVMLGLPGTARLFFEITSVAIGGAGVG